MDDVYSSYDYVPQEGFAEVLLRTGKLAETKSEGQQLFPATEGNFAFFFFTLITNMDLYEFTYLSQHFHASMQMSCQPPDLFDRCFEAFPFYLKDSIQEPVFLSYLLICAMCDVSTSSPNSSSVLVLFCFVFCQRSALLIFSHQKDAETSPEMFFF